MPWTFSFGHSSAAGCAPILGRAKYRRRGRQPWRITDQFTPGGHATPRPRPSGLQLVDRDVVRQDLPVERLRIDPEQRRRLGAMSAHLPQGRDDVLALHLLKAPAPRRWRGLATSHLRWKVVRADLVARAEDHGPLDGMLQLPHVPRPVVALQHLERGWRQPLHAVAGIPIEK